MRISTCIFLLFLLSNLSYLHGQPKPSEKLTSGIVDTGNYVLPNKKFESHNNPVFLNVGSTDLNISLPGDVNNKLDFNLGIVDCSTPIIINWTLKNTSHTKCLLESIDGNCNCVVWNGKVTEILPAKELTGSFEFTAKSWGKGALRSIAFKTSLGVVKMKLFGTVGRGSQISRGGGRVVSNEESISIEELNFHLVDDQLKLKPLGGVRFAPDINNIEIQLEDSTTDYPETSEQKYKRNKHLYRITANPEITRPFQLTLTPYIIDPEKKYKEKHPDIYVLFQPDLYFDLSSRSILSGFFELPYDSLPIKRSISVRPKTKLKFLKYRIEGSIDGVTVTVNSTKEDVIVVNASFSKECPVNTKIEGKIILEFTDPSLKSNNSRSVMLPISGFILNRSDKKFLDK